MGMAVDWKKVRLSEIADYKTGKLNSNAAIENGEYPFFTCSRETFRTNTWSFDCECVLLAGNNANAEYPVKYFKGKFDAYQRTYVITAKDPSKLNIRYLYYGIELKLNLLKSLSTGSATRFLTKGIIDNLEFYLPSKAIQDEFVRILGSYDNLIDNNNRRIAILEDMAQSLYREWFVKFRFPDHENVKFKDSPLGQIPEGWEVKVATDVIEFAPKMSLPKDGEKPFVAMPSISTSSMIIGDIEMRSGNSGTKFKNGDTLMARITPCLQNGKIGFVQFLDEENPIGFGSTEFIVMRSKGLTPEFVYCLARSGSFRGNAINSMAGADGRQRVKNDCFKSYYLAVPPKEIFDKFSALAEPAFKEVSALNQKNKNLRKQRDMLLPKLISGSIKL